MNHQPLDTHFDLTICLTAGNASDNNCSQLFSLAEQPLLIQLLNTILMPDHVIVSVHLF